MSGPTAVCGATIDRTASAAARAAATSPTAPRPAMGNWRGRRLCAAEDRGTRGVGLAWPGGALTRRSVSRHAHRPTRRRRLLPGDGRPDGRKGTGMTNTRMRLGERWRRLALTFVLLA